MGVLRTPPRTRTRCVLSFYCWGSMGCCYFEALFCWIPLSAIVTLRFCALRRTQGVFYRSIYCWVLFYWFIVFAIVGFSLLI
ncbi:hypothetical protein T492DRAFT_1077867 [Pavlovales sp. CCMP2436]|nr:hypothetical protein T492DRAFT_1077867 [Pavlovales sp. CCMP2436]